MASSPEDFVALGERLLSGDSEVEWRVACHVAYYAAFHQCRDEIDAIGIPMRPKRRHENVIDAYKDFAPGSRRLHRHQLEIRTVGMRLKQLGSWRNRADYELKQTITRGHAEIALGTSKDILQSVRRVIQDVSTASS